MNFFERYQFDRNTDRLGKGGFGEVFRAFDSLLHQHVALKFYPQEEGQEKYGVIDEMKTAIRLNHPNIVRVFDADIVEVTDNFGKKHKYEVGIMELVEGGSLRDFIDKKPNPAEIQAVVMGMMKGLEYLHSHNIIHRDLKPANILIKYENGNPVPKIVDFGISKLAANDFTSRTGIIGTYEYIAPEMLDVDAFGINGKITTNTDMWSFGVMLYELMTGGDLPYGSRKFGMTEGQIIAKILGNQNLTKIETIPQPYKRIIELCLVKQAAQRVGTMTDLLTLFEKKTQAQQQNTRPISQQQATQVQNRPQPQRPQNKAPQNYGQQALTQYKAGGFANRFIAYFLDTIIMFIIGIGYIFLITGDFENIEEKPFVSWIVMGLLYLYFLFKDGANGASLGKRAAGIQVIHISTGEPIGYGRAFLRNILYLIPFLNGLIFLVDFIMILANSDGRRIGDNIANTIVIKK